MDVKLGKDGIYSASEQHTDGTLCIGESEFMSVAMLNCQKTIDDRTNFARDFLLGQNDCKDGKLARNGTDAYERGYSAQYHHEQNMTELHIRGRHGIR